MPDKATMTEAEIVVDRARCMSFQGGFCYSARFPYYTGHYETHAEATRAAIARRRALADPEQTR